MWAAAYDDGLGGLLVTVRAAASDVAVDARADPGHPQAGPAPQVVSGRQDAQYETASVSGAVRAGVASATSAALRVTAQVEDAESRTDQPGAAGGQPLSRVALFDVARDGDGHRGRRC